MLEHAAAFAEARGWDYKILSPDHIVLSVESSRHQVFFDVSILCIFDARIWGVFTGYDFSSIKERFDVVPEAFKHMKQFFSQAEPDMPPKPERFVRYIVEIEIIEDIPTYLGSAIDQVLIELTDLWAVLQFINLGGTSVDGIDEKKSSELNELCLKTSVLNGCEQ